MGLVTSREVDAWQRLSSLGAPLAVDLSQSLGRCCRFDACVPTVTPSARLAVVCNKVRRLVTQEEKLLLQGFPLHRMRFPEGMSSAAIGECAGNAMHVRCIAAAIVIATSLVNSNRPWQPCDSLAHHDRRAQPRKRPNVAPPKQPKAKRRVCLGGATPAKSTARRRPADKGNGGVTRRGGVTPSPMKALARQQPALENLFGN